MAKSTGRVTLPSESNFLQQTKELLERWGADAIRDSDGTKLSDDVKELDAKIYTTYFVARGHNDFAQKHMDECQQAFLMSSYTLATSNTLTIPFLKDYFDQQVKADYDHDPKIWWEVYDRTEGYVLDSELWCLNEKENTVTIENCIPFHEYTVSFLAYLIWDPIGRAHV